MTRWQCVTNLRHLTYVIGIYKSAVSLGTDQRCLEESLNHQKKDAFYTAGFGGAVLDITATLAAPLERQGSHRNGPDTIEEQIVRIRFHNDSYDRLFSA